MCNGRVFTQHKYTNPSLKRRWYNYPELHPERHGIPIEVNIGTAFACLFALTLDLKETYKGFTRFRVWQIPAILDGFLLHMQSQVLEIYWNGRWSSLPWCTRYDLCPAIRSNILWSALWYTLYRVWLREVVCLSVAVVVANYWVNWLVRRVMSSIGEEIWGFVTMNALG